MNQKAKGKATPKNSPKPNAPGGVIKHAMKQATGGAGSCKKDGRGRPKKDLCGSADKVLAQLSEAIIANDRRRK